MDPWPIEATTLPRYAPAVADADRTPDADEATAERVAELTAEVAALKAQVARLEAAARELERVKRSNSWRVTEPLRAAKARLAGRP